MTPTHSFINYSSNSEVVSPGNFVLDALEAQNIKQKDLSLLLGKSASVINDIIKGKRSINAEIAVLLEAVTDIKAQSWMEVQSNYVINQAYKDEDISKRYHKIKDWLKIKPCINTNILKKFIDIKGEIEDVDKLLSYAGVKTAEEFCTLPEKKIAKFRRSNKLQTDIQNLFTWTLIARHKSAIENLDSNFDPNNLEEISFKLNEILYLNKDVEEKTKNLLNLYGIKFLKLKNFEKTPIDGYSFWEGKNPTIVLTMRYDRIDNFAFNLFHELGHIILHLSQDSKQDFIGTNCDESEIRDSQEKEANDFAKKQLRRGINLDRLFGKWKNQYTAYKFLLKLSLDNRINLGIVTGQYQNYCSNYTINRDLLEKIN